MIDDKPEPAASPVSEARTQDELDLEPIKTREAAATKGPWRADRPRVVWRIRTASGGYIFEGNQYQASVEANALFLAHARADIPALIAEIERLRAASSSSRTPTPHYEAWDLVQRWRANGGRLILLKYAANELEAALWPTPEEEV